MQAGSSIEIVDFSSCGGDAFGHLNREWLERFFRVEPIDEEMLSDRQSTIIDPGGTILYALENGTDALGTVALKYQGKGVCELTKMAVTQSSAIDNFAELGGKMLYLESHNSLGVALALYESAGFRHKPRPNPSEYERADVYMVYLPE